MKNSVEMSRMRKTLLNARVNLIYFLITIVVSFFSRKLFLDYLGADFVGLTSTLISILGFLNLAELGIGVAIGQVLYKPLYEEDQLKINEIVSLYGFLYKRIGIIILIVGIVISIFLPLIFEKSIFELGVIYFAFYSYLISSLLSYFFNFQQTLLQADQKGYLVQKYYQAFNILKLLIQMLVVYKTQNYYLWIVIELLGGVSYTLILKWRMGKEYPWLLIEIRDGKNLLKKYKEIITKVKQLFIHKISSFTLTSLSPIIIYGVVSLKYVAFYNNYMLVFGKLSGLLSAVLQSSWAGVGNLVAEGNKENIQKIFWELIALRFWIGGSFFIILYYLLDLFIGVWIGSQYLLSHNVLILMLVHFFMMQVRGPVDNFIYAYGLFSDVWAPAIEGIINISVAIIGGIKFGISGVVAGSVISMLIIVFGWKPVFLFKKGFNKPILIYYKKIFILVFCFVIVWIIIDIILAKIVDKNTLLDNYKDMTLYALKVISITLFIWTIALYVVNKGMKELLKRVFNRLKVKNV